MKKYIVQVAPLVPLPVLGTQVFSYWHDEALPTGTLVSAPFYFREIRGIVVDAKKNSLPKNSLKLKNIYSVIEKKFLSENQVNLARKIAEYYFSPLGSVLKLMIPKIVKRREKGKNTSEKAIKSGKTGELAMRICESGKTKFLLSGSGKQTETINADLIRAEIKKKKQCLILVPEIFFAESVYEKLRDEFSEEIALIHSRITKGQYYGWWKKIKSGETKIIIATKLGIFLPFCDLGLIIVRENEDASFKQWQAMPRYNGALGAEFLAEISGAKLVLESSAPSAEGLHRAKNGEFEILGLNDSLPKLEIIFPEKIASSAIRRGGGNPDFPISKALYSRLAEIVKRDTQSVVFVNRRGFSTRSMCENCKRVLKCPKCGVALAYSEEHGQYRCLRCAFRMDILSACPSCGGFQFSHRGVGTQTVEKKIQRLFPSARIVRLDADSLRVSAAQQETMKKFAEGKIDILVGTQSAIKGIYSSNIELAASISGRDFADGIEFNSRETALSRVFHMANLLNENGKLLIQTFFGGNALFDCFQKSDFKKYFARELLLRKKFAYPPFRKFAKLVFRDKSEKKAVSETKKAFDLLLRTGNNEVEIVGPYESFGQKKGLYQRNILLKFDSEKDIGDLPVRSVLGGLRKGWVIDVDPISLI